MAGAVNSQISFSSTVLVNVPANTTTVIAQSTISTDGGYVKVRASMQVFRSSGSTSPAPQIVLGKGGISGTRMIFYGNVFFPVDTLSGTMGTCVTIEYVDTALSASQQYTVTAYSVTEAIQIDAITFVVENAKV
ncbi:MAG: hypothetical protein ABI072_09450 [Edaphobacter sp.]